MTKGTLPTAPEEPDGTSLPAMPATAPVPQTVIWVHDGPVCVTVVDRPSPHAASGVCRCVACHEAYDPDRAVHFY
jgi:hypothetical protein